MQPSPTGVNGFDLQQLPRTPWKNGGGLTREVLCQPPQAGLADFDWRVSVASIAASGPFSVFEGVDRSITLLDGAGVRLHGAGHDHALTTRWLPHAFAGELPLQCTLLGGPSTDFNVMVRRDRARADVRVLDTAAAATAALASARHGVLLALAGDWTLDSRAAGRSARTLAPGQGVWWSGAAIGGCLASQRADAALLCVSVTLLHEES